MKCQNVHSIADDFLLHLKCFFFKQFFFNVMFVG